MNPFRAPVTKYTNFYDEARFNLTWKLNMFMFLTNLPLLVIAMIYFPIDEFLSVLFGWLVPLVYIIILYFTRKYKALAIVYVSMGTLTTGALMCFVASDFHLVEIVFMTMISLYAFLTLGRLVGILTIAVHIFWIFYYLIYGLNAELIISTQLNTIQLFWLATNILVAFSMVSYLLSEFIKLNHYAEQKYIAANNELTLSNSAIEIRDREKTVMLQEIHHRVKNNLQVITSLLRLQSHEVEDVSAKSKFDDAINRVVAMSMIHEKMYRSSDLSSLNLQDYLTALTKDLIDSYSVVKPIEIIVNTTVDRIGSKTIVPLSLLFNELISNSLKHAFNQKEKGVIDISIKASKDDYLEIEYADNGCWKFSEFNKSFGCELIDILAEQMSGDITRISDDEGTKYKFSVKNLD